MSKGAPDAPKSAKPVSTSVIGKDFAALTQQLHDIGCFKPNYADEVFKLVLTLLPGIIGFYLLRCGSPALGSAMVGFSYYMSGWTSHDYLHHGVIKGSSHQMVRWNNWMGFFLGGLWQGYAVEWWRARHNTHHLVTNEAGNDPDIMTSPVLTFVRNNPKIANALNAAQRWQQYYYVPAMARRARRVERPQRPPRSRTRGTRGVWGSAPTPKLLRPSRRLVGHSSLHRPFSLGAPRPPRRQRVRRVAPCRAERSAEHLARPRAQAMMDAYWRFESLQYLAARPFKKVWLSWALLAVHYPVLFYLYRGQLAWLAFG